MGETLKTDKLGFAVGILNASSQPLPEAVTEACSDRDPASQVCLRAQAVL